MDARRWGAANPGAADDHGRVWYCDVVADRIADPSGNAARRNPFDKGNRRDHLPTAIAALIGRLGLAKFADRIDARVTASAVFLVAAISYCALAVSGIAIALFGASMLFGLTVGNITTLSPIIVRREFGAAAFGPVFGVASCAIQFASAIGPGFYGFVHDAFGGYGAPLLIAAAADFVAATVLMAGRRLMRRRDLRHNHCRHGVLTTSLSRTLKAAGRASAGFGSFRRNA